MKRIISRKLPETPPPQRGSTDYSLHILSFNNPAIQYFPTFPKILKILPNSYTLKTFEESSKKSQKIIEPRTATKLRHFFIK